MKPSSRIALGGLLVMGLAACQPAGHYKQNNDNYSQKTGYYFDQMDTSGDGVINLAEARLFSEKKFYKADLNGDGRLTREEFMESKHRSKNAYQSMENDGYQSKYQGGYDGSAHVPHPNKDVGSYSYYGDNNSNDYYFFNNSRNRWERR